MEQFGSSGVSQLNVPKGRWLTGSFNLTSNFTLFLEDGAVILGSQVQSNCFPFLCNSPAARRQRRRRRRWHSDGVWSEGGEEEGGRRKEGGFDLV
ncbi:Probable polygalacturonase [Linum perenne]